MAIWLRHQFLLGKTKKNSSITLLVGSTLAVLVTYFILSKFSVSSVFAISISLLLGSLVFGVSRDMLRDNRPLASESEPNHNKDIAGHENRKDRKVPKLVKIFNQHILTFSFAIIYGIAIALANSSYINEVVYLPWEDVSLVQYASMPFAIMLAFFLPGYAVVNSLDPYRKIGTLLKFLLSYLISIFIAGSIGLYLGVTGTAFSDGISILTIVYIIIFLQFLAIAGLRIYRSRNSVPDTADLTVSISSKIRDQMSFIIVMAALTGIIVVFTYYLYGGTIIGDQWDHHGRSLLFLEGTFSETIENDLISPYPPFFSAFLSSYFSLAGGMPTVNSYVAINFLNIIPAFAFYYMFCSWLPSYKRGALLATVLFSLGSGYGWMYAVYLADMNEPSSDQTPLNTLISSSFKTLDIWVPTNFMAVGHPDITTGLILIALPAGFVIICLLNTRVIDYRKISLLILTFCVSLLGMLSHDEFGLFVITASLIPIFFDMKNKGTFYGGILTSLIALALLSLVPNLNYYHERSFFDVPFVILLILFNMLTWFIYTTELRSKLIKFLSHFVYRSPSQGYTRSNKISRAHLRLILSIAVTAVVAYLYMISFIMWYLQLSELDVRRQELKTVPWHFLPLRLGVPGLLGIAFIVSYIYRRYEKEVLVFGVLAIVAFLTGPYYDEQRFNKYIMSVMAVFASLFILKIVLLLRGWKPGIASSIVGSVIVSSVLIASSMSVVLYGALNYLGVNGESTDFNDMLPRRHFVSSSDLDLIENIKEQLRLPRENIALSETELASSYHGFGAVLRAFGGLPGAKIYQSPSSLQEDSLPGLYYLLDYSESKFIALSKEYISSKEQTFPPESEILGFVTSHFPKIYENKDYILYSVPYVTGPSNSSRIGVVTTRSIEDYNTRILSNETLYYNRGETYSYLSPWGANATSNTVFGDATILSPPLGNFGINDINYLDVTLTTISSKGNDNHNGLTWIDGNDSYYVLFRDNTLSFHDSTRGEFVSYKIERQLGVDNRLQVTYSNNTINVFLNGILKLQVPRISEENVDISTVGVRAFNSDVISGPIHIGRVSTLTEDPVYNNHDNYLLSSLALAGLDYTVFSPNDLSNAFASSQILLVSGKLDELAFPNDALKFQQEGGTLVIFDSFDNLYVNSIGMSDCRTTHGSRAQEFNSITTDNNIEKNEHIVNKSLTLPISGTTNHFWIQCTNDSASVDDVISSYTLNGLSVVPLAISISNYSNTLQSELIMVNSEGLFNAVSKRPDVYFQSLSEVLAMLGIETWPTVANITNSDNSSMVAIPATRFEDGVLVSGQIRLSSSSLHLDTGVIPLRVEELNVDGNVLLNRTIRDLEIYGDYDSTVVTDKLSYEPEDHDLTFGYVDLEIPNGSNFTISFNSNNSYGIITLDTGDTYRIGGNGILQLANVSAEDWNMETIPIVVRTPTLEVDGSIRFSKLRSNDPSNMLRPWANAAIANITGDSSLVIDHVTSDTDNQARFITYFDWSRIDFPTDKPIESSGVNELIELNVYLYEAVTSGYVQRITVSLFIASAVALYFLWGRSARKRIGGQINNKGDDSD